MNKPKIFISHISEEKEIALALKSLIGSSFLGMIDVFVSSDYASVSLGRKWLDDVTASLKQCDVEIIICSPISVERQWINFEAGAGWVRDILVIPLCHSGMEPEELPIPLKLLQSGKATEEANIRELFRQLANVIGSTPPNVDYGEFIKKVRSFELTYSSDSSNLLSRLTAKKSPELGLPDLLFEHDDTGNAIDGNIECLIEAVIKCHRIKIRIHQPNNSIKVIDAQSISVENGVVHATNTDEISLTRDDLGNYVYQKDAYHYYVVVSSNGHHHATRIYLDGRKRNTTDSKRHMAWFGFVPPS